MHKPLNPYPGVYSDGIRCKVYKGLGPRRNGDIPAFTPREEYEQDESKY